MKAKEAKFNATVEHIQSAHASMYSRWNADMPRELHKSISQQLIVVSQHSLIEKESEECNSCTEEVTARRCNLSFQLIWKLCEIKKVNQNSELSWKKNYVEVF